MQKMEDILQKLHLGRCIPNFIAEKITPDIVGHLSMYDMNVLGVVNRSDMMNLRTSCVCYGSGTPHKSNEQSGPPQFQIPKTTIETLMETGFQIKEIATLLSVSESTVYRRMRQYNLRKYQFTDIDDDRLTTIVKETVDEFPRCGEKMLQEILRQKNIKIPRFRLRDMLHEHDENGVNRRHLGRLHRRVYHVQGPNHMWHVDTNHKLIRWFFIIIGGIDGFSRLIMFLQCEDNNKSGTLLKIFKEGVDTFGLPLCVRTDKGRENVLIADLMIERRGNSGIKTGRSVHNQRIERLWRDVYDGVLGYYSVLFSFMEDEGILDIMDATHICALHYVYKHKINEKLNLWKEAWASHRMRTTRTSPLRLWTSGMMVNPVGTEQHGTEDEAIVPENNSETDTRPILETVHMDIDEQCRQRLGHHCPKDWSCANSGIDIYLKAVRILNNNFD